MIYNFAQTSLESLANKFGELADAFSSLAAALPSDSSEGATTQQLQAKATELAESIAGAASAIPSSGNAKGALETARDIFAYAGVELISGSGTRPKGQAVYPNGLQPVFIGEFGDKPRPDEIDGITTCRGLLEDLSGMIVGVLGEIESVTELGVGAGYNLRGIRKGVEGIRDGIDRFGGSSGGFDNLVSYPMLVSDSDCGPAGPAGAASVQRLVDSAMRQTLGRLPKYTDTKAFIAALNQSFEVKQIDGQTTVNWRVRSYVGQTELGGGVTGSQASLYARARDALSQSLPLLESLRPLLPDADVEEMAAARSIVRSQFTALVDELGVEGGPREQRVEELFGTLLHDRVAGQDPGTYIYGGMVGYLGFTYGLERRRVNTVDEERAFSDFLLLTDYIKTLEYAWDAVKDTLPHDLGTGLVLLSNALQVVGESVDEVEAAMDSVFVGPAERTITEFPTGDFVKADMTVSELLSWIRAFATQEAPQLIQDGGLRGVGAIVGTTEQLRDLVGFLIRHLPNLSAGLRHPRVRSPLTELQQYLQKVVDDAGNLLTQVSKA